MPSQVGVCYSDSTLGWVDLIFPRSVRAEDVQPQAVKIIRGAVLATAAVLTIVAGFGWAREAHDSWKDWRSDSLVTTAENYFENGDFGSGFATANKAYSESPRNVDAIRCLARRCEEVGAKEALFFCDRLEALGQMTAEDSTVRVAALIKSKRFKEAQELATRLLARSHVTTRLIELGTFIDNAGYAMPARLKMEAQSRMRPDANPEDSLAIAAMWMKSESAEERAQAESLLWHYAESGDRHDSWKATILLHRNLRPTDPRSTYLAWLMTEQPDADAAQRLRALSRVISSGPHRQDNWLEDAMASWREASINDRSMLGKMLVSCSKANLVNGLFTREEAVSSPKVAELYVAGMMSTNKYEESLALLKDQDLLISRAQRMFAETTVTIRNSIPQDDARRLLLRALDAASAEANPSLMTGVAELAMDVGLPLVAEQAYNECLTVRGSEPAAYDGLIAVYNSTGDTNRMLHTVKQALDLWPGNEEYLETHAYLSLLSGTDMECAASTVARLYEARPHDQMRLLLRSLANLRFGNSTWGRADLKKLCTHGGIPARYRAVIGGLLKSAGDSETSAEIVTGIKDDQITLPEERAFLQMARL